MNKSGAQSALNAPRSSPAQSAPNLPAPADTAAMALEAAAKALRVYSAALAALESRLVAVEHKLEASLSERSTNTATPCTIPPALELEQRSHVDTATAARWLNRKPQTLRSWACLEDGPLRPLRVAGRLAWAVADIRRSWHSRRLDAPTWRAVFTTRYLD